ncbi:MAG: replicative DNA helicase [Gammaproteobacteria bacterium]|nr:replicative DNA helicase [Gammaproteobacteria bacterium]
MSEWAGREILAVDAPRSGGPRGMDTIAREWVARQAEREIGMTGLKTGFVDFDAATHGLHPGELVYLAARPGMGKTSLALDIARQVASQGHSVLIFSLEMPGVDLFDRLVAQRGRVDLQALRGGQLSEDETERTSAAAAELVRLSLKIDDTPALTTTAIRARARRHKQKQGLDLLVIDYLGLIRGPGENRTREIGNISRDLKALAKELSVPVLCLAQLNRSLEQRTDSRPKLSDLRDSGDIEQDADLVAFIYRDEVYREGSHDKGLAELSIAKQRQGPCKTILLTFQAESTGFSNADHGSQRGWMARKNQGNARGIYDEL